MKRRFLLLVLLCLSLSSCKQRDVTTFPGYDFGYEDGYKQGYEDALAEKYDEIYDIGFCDGYDFALEEYGLD